MVEMTSSVDKRKITSLQALRALSFLGIFLAHAGAPYEWSELGVAVFFVLSGFLMIYTYYDKEIPSGIKGCARFSFRKIGKLYPLHIITMICAIVLKLVVIVRKGITLQSITILLGEIGLNITLLQTWFPNWDVNSSLNGVAWYLSVTMFLYFVFPLIKKWIKRKEDKQLLGICVLLFIIEILVCMPFIYFVGEDSKVYAWFMYGFPIFRLGDFFAGCCLGKFFVCKQESELTFIKGSVIEILATLLAILVYKWLNIGQSSLVFRAMHNRTTLFIPLAVIWVYLFSISKGVITKAFNNSVFVFAGNISAYAFLIHYVIVRYTDAAFHFLGISLPMRLKLIVIGIELLMSIFFSYAYMQWEKGIRSYMVNKKKDMI